MNSLLKKIIAIAIVLILVGFVAVKLNSLLTAVPPEEEEKKEEEAVVPQNSVSCPYPVSIKLDGSFSDCQGANFVYAYTKSSMSSENALDLSFDFAVAADGEYLYVAVVVRDDNLIMEETNDHYDDSIEIYIDANHNRSQVYQSDDGQITIPLINSVMRNIENPLLLGVGDGALTGTKAFVTTTPDGWLVKAAIPLKNEKWEIEPEEGKTIGFNIQVNDDDDYGYRDNQLSWSNLDSVIDNRSWKDTSVFGELKFVSKNE